MILVDRTSNGRPGILESKNTLDIVSDQFLIPAFLSYNQGKKCTKPTDLSGNWIEDCRFNTEEWYGRRAWFRFNRTREGCDDNGSRLSLPNSISQTIKSQHL